MRSLHLISLFLIILLATCAGCRRIGASVGVNPKLPSSRLNPYKGSVKDILPQQVGDYMLVQTSSLKEIEQELVNPSDGVGAIYNSSNNHTVQHLLVSFPSAVEANRELDAALKRYQNAHMDVQVAEIKDENGQSAGRRLTVNDDKTQAMNWTNGSLYCTVVSYSGYSSDFVRNLPY